MVLIGDGAVGKTSIAHRYLKKGFETEYLRTVGADFYMQRREYIVEGVGEIAIKWNIWDLGGQPAFESVRKSFYKGARAAFLVFDITRPETFHNVPNWVNEYIEATGDKHPLILVANKLDLRGAIENEVSKAAGEKYSEALSDYMNFNVPFIETSAKQGKNIDKAFDTLATLTIKQLSGLASNKST